MLMSIVMSKARAMEPAKLRRLIGVKLYEAGFAIAFYWKDETKRHDATTALVKKQNYLAPPPTHSNIQRWCNNLNWTPNLPTLWKHIWLPIRSKKENLFLWQIIYQVPTTNGWKHPGVPCNSPEMWCQQCDLPCYESIQHCFWWCP